MIFYRGKWRDKKGKTQIQEKLSCRGQKTCGNKGQIIDFGEPVKLNVMKTKKEKRTT